MCGALWEKDQRIRAVAAADGLVGQVALVTITAPGREFFTPKESICHDRDVWERFDWNRTARRRWAGCHREASGAARAAARRLDCDWRVLYRSWEYQKRGLLHVHLVLPFSTAAEREATGRYVAELAACAGWWGFGFILGGSRKDHPRANRPPRLAPADARKAGAYVAKYVSSMGAGKEGMRHVAERAGKRGSVLHIAPKLTRRSGVTMRSLRGRRAVLCRYPWAGESMRLWRVACAAHGVQRGRPPLEPESDRAIVDALLTSRSWGVWNDRTGTVIPPTDAAPPLHLLREHGPAPPPRAAVRLSLASVRHRVHTPVHWSPPTTRLTTIRQTAV